MASLEPPTGNSRRRPRQGPRRSGHARTSPSEQAQASIVDVLQRVRVAISTVQIYGLIVSSSQEGVVFLDGAVRTNEAHETAARLAEQTPGVQRVINRLVVDPLAGSMPVSRAVTSPELAAEIELNQFHVAASTADNLNDIIGTTDTAIAADEAEPFFPPTDPVVDRAPREEGGYTVVGGFSQTALDAPIELEQLPRPLLHSDDEIARMVRLALKEDAFTSDLPVYVTVRNGVVHLRGIVPSLADSDVVEEVAARVPGVVEVQDELEVIGI